MFISLHQQTPLHEAASRSSIDTVTFLVDKGAEVNIKNKFGVSTSIDNIPTMEGLEMREYLFWVTRFSGKCSPPIYMYSHQFIANNHDKWSRESLHFFIRKSI